VMLYEGHGMTRLNNSERKRGEHIYFTEDFEKRRLEASTKGSTTQIAAVSSHIINHRSNIDFL
jgi:hypothetical protein